MSDSDSDNLLPNNVYSFQNECTTFHAKGPNLHRSNTTMSFCNKNTSTSMIAPRNFTKQRYAESTCSQRSIYYGREISPASLRSGSDLQPRNFHNSFYTRNNFSQRSMINGRSGSPMSVRSTVSNATMCASDIASTLYAGINEAFNKNDLRIIQMAYKALMKPKMRQKVEKRRNRKLMYKPRRKSGYDSGELGSNSSISSNDCKSTKTDYVRTYREDIPQSFRDTRSTIDFVGLKKAMSTSNENTMYRDCSENFKQNKFKNMFSIRPRVNTSNLNSTLIQSTVQRDRFARSLLPSQRFNQSIAAQSIPEEQNRISKNNNNNFQKPKSIEMFAKEKRSIINDKSLSQFTNKIPSMHRHQRYSRDSESETDEIFSNITIRERKSFNQSSQKRNIDCIEEPAYSKEKVCKFSNHKSMSHLKKKSPSKTIPSDIDTFNKSMKEDFIFAKPQFPIKKVVPQSKPKDKLISKSAPILSDFIVEDEKGSNSINSKSVPILSDLKEKDKRSKSQISDITNSIKPIDKVINNTLNDSFNLEEHSQTNVTNDSMRPSFLKRKLFTQTLDVTESVNVSGESASTNSPQANLYKEPKEKCKARKLSNKQSCLDRDIADESNLLNLIHKIVPPDHLNVNGSNKKSIEPDKWDITSMISTCDKNLDDGSDTYTDEEIFSVIKNKNVKPSKIISCEAMTNPNNKSIQKANIITNKSSSPHKSSGNTNDKIPIVKLDKLKVQKVAKNKSPIKDNGVCKNSIHRCVESFWNIDEESDIENQDPLTPIKKVLNKKNDKLEVMKTSKTQTNIKVSSVNETSCESLRTASKDCLSAVIIPQKNPLQPAQQTRNKKKSPENNTSKSNTKSSTVKNIKNVVEIDQLTPIKKVAIKKTKVNESQKENKLQSTKKKVVTRSNNSILIDDLKESSKTVTASIKKVPQKTKNIKEIIVDNMTNANIELQKPVKKKISPIKKTKVIEIQKNKSTVNDDIKVASNPEAASIKEVPQKTTNTKKNPVDNFCLETCPLKKISSIKKNKVNETQKENRLLTTTKKVVTRNNNSIVNDDLKVASKCETASIKEISQKTTNTKKNPADSTIDANMELQKPVKKKISLRSNSSIVEENGQLVLIPRTSPKLLKNITQKLTNKKKSPQASAKINIKSQMNKDSVKNDLLKPNKTVSNNNNINSELHEASKNQTNIKTCTTKIYDLNNSYILNDKQVLLKKSEKKITNKITSPVHKMTKSNSTKKGINNPTPQKECRIHIQNSPKVIVNKYLNDTISRIGLRPRNSPQKR